MAGRRTIALAAVAALGMGACASAQDSGGTRMVYAGGHNPARLVRAQPRTPSAPYALTGRQAATREVRYVPIRTDSRTIGVRPVAE